MQRFAGLPAPVVLLLVLAAVVAPATAAAALQLQLSNLSADAAPAYAWDVSSSLTSADNITLYANQSSLAAFRVDVRRQHAGAAYFVAGTLSATNPADAPGPVTVSVYRLLLAPGLFGLLGPTPKALPDCAAGELQPGETASCDFRLQLSGGGANSVAPGATLRGAPAVSGASSPLSFPEPSNDAGGDETDAAASDDGADGGGSGCAVVSDSIQAGAAAAGFSATTSTSADGGALLRDSGARVCGESAVFKYTLQVGPFDGLEGVCGSYKFSNQPRVQLLGYGSSSVAAASGQLTIGGCRQRDMLGLLKPAVSISTLTVARMTKYSWAASTSTVAADAAKAAGAAAAAAGAEAGGAVAASDGETNAPADGAHAPGAPSIVAFDGTIAVTSALQLNRSSSTQNALIGEVTLTNTEVMPYMLAGVQLVITPKQGRSSSASSNTSTAAPAAAGAATSAMQQPQQQLVFNVSCPLERADGSIVVPPQLLAGLPGTLRCAFELPLNASWAAGTLQAQARTLLSKEFDADSGQPQPYDFAANASAVEVGGCVAVWGRRLMPAAAGAGGSGGDAAVPAVEQAGNADLERVLALARTHGYKLAPAPARVTGGRVPPAPGGLLAVPLTVCANRSLQWTEVYGPFTKLDCGSSLSVLSLSIKPRGGAQPDINATIAHPLTVTGCGMVPELAMHRQLVPSAKKVFTWSVKRRITPAEGLSLDYSTQEVVKYDITFNRSFVITGRRLQGVVRLTNPHATPLTISRVSFSLSRPAGRPALSGPAVCSSDAAGAADAASQLFDEQQAPPLQPFTLPASPTAVAAQAAEAAASKAASGSGGGGLFGLLRSSSSSSSSSNSRGLAAAGDGAGGADGSGAPGSTGKNDASATADAAADVPPPAVYCSFVVAVPDGDAAQLVVHALTDDGEQSSVQAAVDWKAAQLYEFGKCALVAAAFQQTQPATLLQPASVRGSMPPGPEAAVRVCEPTRYQFGATFGPFKADECGSRQAIAVAAVSVPGLQNATQEDATTAISVTGCPDRLPLLALQPPTPSQVTTSYEWSVEHSLEPLSSAAAAVTPGARTAASSAITVSDPGGWALFNQTVAFKRSKPVQHRRRYQLRGSVSLINANDKPQALSSLQLRVSRPGSQGEPLAAVEARCPRVTSLGAKAGASSSAQQQQPTAATAGVVLLPPAGGKPVVCNYSVLLTDVQPASGGGSGSGGPVVEVVAVAVLAADGRRAKSGPMPARVDLADVKPVTLGWCAKASEAQQLLLPGTSNGDAAAAAPSFVGARVPPAGEVLCGPKTYQMLAQLGPLQPATANARSGSASSSGGGGAGSPACGSVRYVSTVTLEPTSGFQAKQHASGQLDVVFKGCDAGGGDV